MWDALDFKPLMLTTGERVLLTSAIMKQTGVAGPPREEQHYNPHGTYYSQRQGFRAQGGLADTFFGKPHPEDNKPLPKPLKKYGDYTADSFKAHKSLQSQDSENTGQRVLSSMVSKLVREKKAKESLISQTPGRSVMDEEDDNVSCASIELFSDAGTREPENTPAEKPTITWADGGAE